MKYMNKVKQCMFFLGIMAICGFVIYLFVLPDVGRKIIYYFPEFEHAFIPWLIFLWLTGIPCYIVLYEVWKLCESFYLNDLFNIKNGYRMHKVSILAKFDIVLLIGGNIVFLFLNINHFSVILFFLMVAFAGVFIATVAEIMSQYIIEAASLKEETELTI